MQDHIYNLYSGVYKRAVELFNDGAYIEAFTKFKAVVENDEANYKASYFLAECYFNGLGTKKDLRKAYENYHKAAINHYVPAAYMLGLCYEMGYGVDTDETQAVAWYMEATKYDYADAEYRLGMCYKEGKGIARSYPHAASWLLKAGQKGNVDAQREAAICYEMLNQATAAARLFLAAAEAGDLYSEEKIAEYYAEGYGCPKHEGLAIEYYNKACNKGSISAMLTLAYRYANGDGISLDLPMAVHWWMKAAPKSTEAQFALSECYIEGKGIFKDIPQGLKWLEKAASENNTKAMLKLANYALNPINNREADPQAAKTWYTKAASLGDIDAMYMLGRCFEECIGISHPNYAEAYKWYRLASQKGHEMASDQCKKFKRGFLGKVKLNN